MIAKNVLLGADRWFFRLLLALVAGRAALGQEREAAAYVGPAICMTCHNGLTSTNRPPEFHRCLVEKCKASAHADTMFDARAEPARVVAPLDADSPLKREQIACGFGAGRGEQRYSAAAYKLLPHRWSVRNAQWESQPVEDAADRCAGCHTTGYRAADKQWSAMGVTCEACHGPGSLHAKSSGKVRMLSLRSLPADRRGMVCGQCHADGTDLAKVHPFPVDFRPGDDLEAFFAFAPKPRSGPKYTELMRSKHARMNVLCADCHDPHGPVEGAPHQLRKPVIDTCRSCHGEKVMAKHAPQAPGDATCATCHMPDGSHLFRKATQ